MSDVSITPSTVYGYAYIGTVLSDLYELSIPGYDNIIYRLELLLDRIAKIEETS